MFEGIFLEFLLNRIGIGGRKLLVQSTVSNDRRAPGPLNAIAEKNAQKRTKESTLKVDALAEEEKEKKEERGRR